MRGIFLQIITLSSLSLMEDCLRGPELLTPVVPRPGLDIPTGDHYQALLTIGHYTSSVRLWPRCCLSVAVSCFPIVSLE